MQSASALTPPSSSGAKARPRRRDPRSARAPPRAGASQGAASRRHPSDSNHWDGEASIGPATRFERVVGACAEPRAVDRACPRRHAAREAARRARALRGQGRRRCVAGGGPRALRAPRRGVLLSAGAEGRRGGAVVLTGQLRSGQLRSGGDGVPVRAAGWRPRSVVRVRLRSVRGWHTPCVTWLCSTCACATTSERGGRRAPQSPRAGRSGTPCPTHPCSGARAPP